MSVLKPLLDGEKIQEADLLTLFRSPPGFSLEITRSTLLIGARGVGKTTLLRYLVTRSPRSTVYLSLLDELGSIAKDSAGVPDDELAPPEFVQQQTDKADALLAVGLIREMVKKGYNPSDGDLAQALPPLLSVFFQGDWNEWTQHAQKKIFEADRQWTEPRYTGAFRRVVDGFAALAERQGDNLKILMDRADMIPSFAAGPALDLLDQSGQYYALIASRPAPHANPDWGVRGSIQAGDHYRVVNIGNEPRSDAWRTFMREAIKAQCDEAISKQRMPGDVLDSAIYYAGDSVRLGLEIVFETLRGREGNWGDRLCRSLQLAKADLMFRADGALKRWQKKFSSTAKGWREEVITREKTLTIRNPVVVSLSTGTGQPWFAQAVVPATPLDRFVAAGLSVGAFTPRSGEGWYPGNRLESIEIVPLVLWDFEDMVTGQPKGEPIELQMSASAFQGSGGRGPREGRVFVGFRFDFPNSRRFFEQLKRDVSDHPLLSGVRIIDGKLPAGAEWASKIRIRIEKAGLLVICDVTGGRGDLVFELGMGRGLHRAFMPVADSRASWAKLPDWLKTINFGYYETIQDIHDIRDSVLEHLNHQTQFKPRKLPEAVPTVMTVLGVGENNRNLFDRLDAKANADGFSVRELLEITNNNYEDAMTSVAKSALLVLALDGTQRNDTFAHFACGVVAARPSIGKPSTGLKRRIIVIPEDADVSIPDSIKNCQSTITCVTDAAGAVHAVTMFLKEYRAWTRSGTSRSIRKI